MFNLGFRGQWSRLRLASSHFTKLGFIEGSSKIFTELRSLRKDHFDIDRELDERIDTDLMSSHPVKGFLECVKPSFVKRLEEEKLLA